MEPDGPLALLCAEEKKSSTFYMLLNARLGVDGVGKRTYPET